MAANDGFLKRILQGGHSDSVDCGKDQSVIPMLRSLENTSFLLRGFSR
jgi:hypothetical protein